MRHVPGPAAPERRRRRRVQDAVLVDAAARVAARIERVVDERRPSRTATSSGVSAFRLRRSRRDRRRDARHADRSHLPARVHAGVGPAGAAHAHRRAQHDRRAPRSSSPCTVGPPGWSCQPWYAVPSYSTMSRSCMRPRSQRRSRTSASSAICTAFSAPPLRTLSSAIQSARPFSADGSSRMRADVRRVGADDLDGRRIAHRSPTRAAARRAPARSSATASSARQRLLRLDGRRSGRAEEHRHAHGRHAASRGRVGRARRRVSSIALQLVRGGAARLDVAQLRHAVEGDATREARALLAARRSGDRCVSLDEPVDGPPARARRRPE